MTRKMRKNQNWGTSPSEEGARTGQIGMRVPWGSQGIHPAQMAAQSYVKSPMQLAGATVMRRGQRAYQPFMDAVGAMGALNSNVNRAKYNVLRDTARAYFDNADNSGNLRDFSPVMRAGSRAIRQGAKDVQPYADQAYSAVGNAVVPVQDFMGGLLEYGVSGAGALGRAARSAGGSMYRGIRDTVRPMLGDAPEPQYGAPPSMNKRASMCKCGSGMSKSMCKCGGGMSKSMCKCGSGMSKSMCKCGSGKSAKRSLKKRGGKQRIINALASANIGKNAIAATFGHMIPLLIANPPRKAGAIISQHAKMAARDANVGNYFNREGLSSYRRQKRLLQEFNSPRSASIAFRDGMNSASRGMPKSNKIRMANVKRTAMQLAPWLGTSIVGANVINSMLSNKSSGSSGIPTNKRLSKRQAGPKPNKYM
jgi:hypothetical protein